MIADPVAVSGKGIGCPPAIGGKVVFAVMAAGIGQKQFKTGGAPQFIGPDRCPRWGQDKPLAAIQAVTQHDAPVGQPAPPDRKLPDPGRVKSRMEVQPVRLQPCLRLC